MRFKKSKRGWDLSRRSFLSRHSLASVCFFPTGRVQLAQHASETYLGFLASPCCTRDRSRSCGVPLYFHFRCFPRGAVSPYIYLIAPRTTSRSSISLPSTLLPHLHTVGRAHFAPPLYGQFPSPLWRILEIIKSSLSQDWLLCLESACAAAQILLAPSPPPPSPLLLSLSFLSFSLTVV